MKGFLGGWGVEVPGKASEKYHSGKKKSESGRHGGEDYSKEQEIQKQMSKDGKCVPCLLKP